METGLHTFYNIYMESLNERVKRIQGDKEEIGRLIEEYKPFIASCAEKQAGRYLRYGEDDELSIALLAFYEAVGSYNSLKGSYLSFANHVIKRRIIDYYRKEQRRVKVVPLREYIGDSDEEEDHGIDEAAAQYSADEENKARALEIKELKTQLAEWGITFDNLVEASPGQERTREMCSRIVRFLLGRPELIEQIMSRKVLPLSIIQNSLDLTPKKLEKHRKYIIAALLIYMGDYPYLREYINISRGQS